MSGIKTQRKRDRVGIISHVIHCCIDENRLQTNSDIRRCAKIIYKRLEEPAYGGTVPLGDRLPVMPPEEPDEGTPKPKITGNFPVV
jgi:hypothetical protein